MTTTPNGEVPPQSAAESTGITVPIRYIEISLQDIQRRHLSQPFLFGCHILEIKANFGIEPIFGVWGTSYRVYEVRGDIFDFHSVFSTPLGESRLPHINAEGFPTAKLRIWFISHVDALEKLNMIDEKTRFYDRIRAASRHNMSMEDVKDIITNFVNWIEF